jgi:hypothetical protein
VPIVVFNHVPDLAWLKPAKLRHKFLVKLGACKNACSSDDQCPRCGVNAIFKDSHSAFGSIFGQDEVQHWEQRFSNMTQAQAEADLPQTVVLPKPQSPQSSCFRMPAVCILPQTSQLPAPVEHSQYVLESKGKFTVAGLQKMLTKYKKDAKEARQNAKHTTGGNADPPAPLQVSGCEHTFYEVVGVWRDHETGEKLVAVVWEADTIDGGSWIEFDDLHLGVQPAKIQHGAEDSDDEQAFAVDGAEDAFNGDTVRWHREFGNGLAEGTKLVVQWVESTSTGKVFKNYLGELTGDFDSGTYSHEVAYGRCTADKDLHTLGNAAEDSHWMNLASLEVDKETSADDETTDEFFSFWIKASHAHLPFVTKHLFESEKEDPLPKNKAKKRKRAAPKQSLPKPASTSNEQTGVKRTRAQKLKAKMLNELEMLM